MTKTICNTYKQKLSELKVIHTKLQVELERVEKDGLEKNEQGESIFEIKSKLDEKVKEFQKEFVKELQLIRNWEKVKLKLIKTFSNEEIDNWHTDWIHSATITPDGKLLTASVDQAVKITDPNTMKVIKTFSSEEIDNWHSSWSDFAFITPNGNLLTSSADKTVKEFEIIDGE